jgi:hypothetical protein
MSVEEAVQEVTSKATLERLKTKRGADSKYLAREQAEDFQWAALPLYLPDLIQEREQGQTVVGLEASAEQEEGLIVIRPPSFKKERRWYTRMTNSWFGLEPQE